MQELESTQLMVDMLDRPKAFWGHCQRYAGSLIMQIAFNKRANRNTDPAVADMVRTFRQVQIDLAFKLSRIICISALSSKT